MLLRWSKWVRSAAGLGIGGDLAHSAFLVGNSYDCHVPSFLVEVPHGRLLHRGKITGELY